MHLLALKFTLIKVLHICSTFNKTPTGAPVGKPHAAPCKHEVFTASYIAFCWVPHKDSHLLKIVLKALPSANLYCLACALYSLTSHPFHLEL